MEVGAREPSCGQTRGGATGRDVAGGRTARAACVRCSRETRPAPGPPARRVLPLWTRTLSSGGKRTVCGRSEEKTGLVPSARRVPQGRRAGRPVGGSGDGVFRKWSWEETCLMCRVFQKHSKDIYANRVIKTTFLAVRALHWLLYLPAADGNVKALARRTNFFSSKKRISSALAAPLRQSFQLRAGICCGPRRFSLRRPRVTRGGDDPGENGVPSPSRTRGPASRALSLCSGRGGRAGPAAPRPRRPRRASVCPEARFADGVSHSERGCGLRTLLTAGRCPVLRFSGKVSRGRGFQIEGRRIRSRTRQQRGQAQP